MPLYWTLLASVYRKIHRLGNPLEALATLFFAQHFPLSDLHIGALSCSYECAPRLIAAWATARKDAVHPYIARAPFTDDFALEATTTNTSLTDH